MLTHSSKPTIALVAGGTGGHFFPALATATQLHERGYPLALFTDTRTRNLSSLFDRMPQLPLPAAGVVGHTRLHQLRSLFRLTCSMVKASSFIRQKRIKAVLGFGGYPSVPPILGGWLTRPHRPALIIHEGNGKMGRANQLLARFADVTALSFKETQNIPARARTVVTGMPVRDIFLHSKRKEENALSTFNLLIWGGSLGAQFFSDLIPQAITSLAPSLREKLFVTQQVRKEDCPAVEEFYRAHKIKADIRPFFDHPAELLQNADLVIGRAGGSSVAELLATSTPALFIPFPHAAGDEQTVNAQLLEKKGAGWLIPQKDLTIENLTDFLELVMEHPNKLRQASQNACQLARDNAASLLADTVENTLMKKEL